MSDTNTIQELNTIIKELKEKNKLLEEENNNFIDFIKDMNNKIFTKNTNGIGAKMREKLYDIFETSSIGIRKFTVNDSVYGVYLGSYKDFIQDYINKDNKNEWFNKSKTKFNLYFGYL